MAGISSENILLGSGDLPRPQWIGNLYNAAAIVPATGAGSQLTLAKEIDMAMQPEPKKQTRQKKQNAAMAELMSRKIHHTNQMRDKRNSHKK